MHDNTGRVDTQMGLFGKITKRVDNLESTMHENKLNNNGSTVGNMDVQHDGPFQERHSISET